VNEYKILFTGTMGAGKTTAIASISEVPPVVTDVANTDRAIGKPRTTVGLDFGQITLDSGDRLRLFGTPGQSRFDFMWKLLVKNALGLIILTDNSRPDPIGDLDVYRWTPMASCSIGAAGSSRSSPSMSADRKTS
jgi:signal recognition particle receptor subunit beta